MEHRFLGRTGLKVSELWFGVQTFGWVTGEAEAFQMLDRFVDAGGNTFDTADSYNKGESERILGRWLARHGRRSSLVVATKVYFPTGDGPNDMGLSRKHLCEALHGSLRRLQTDYIDVYQVHCWDGATPLEETLSTLADFVREGKIRYFGVSNFTAAQLVKALMLCRAEGWPQVASIQNEYSLLVRTAEWELLDLCQEEGVGFLAWSPLAGGWLTGKYRKEATPPPDSRGGRRDRWEDLPEQRVSARLWAIIDRAEAIAQRTGKTIAQVCLRWVIQRPGVVAPIFGARTLQQLEDNLGSVGWALSDKEMQELDEVSSTPAPYPHDFQQRYARKR